MKKRPRTTRPSPPPLPVPTAYGYCRLSLDQQDSVSIASQEAAIRAYAAHRLPHMRLVILKDPGVSGSTRLFDRPQGQRLTSLVPGDQLIVTKVDRAFRSLADGATTLDRLARDQVGVHCLDVHIDTTTPTGRAMLHMLMVFAQLERERISERRREAAAFRRSRGDCMHIASAPPYGWKVIGRGPDRRYVIDKADRKRCDELRRLNDAGLGVRKIERWAEDHQRQTRLGTPWRKSSIRKAIRASRAGYPNTSELHRKWDVVTPADVQERLRQSRPD